MNQQINISRDTNTVVRGNIVIINGEELPPAPRKGNNSTVINGKVFLDGYEFKNGKWQRTIKALWHKIF